MKTLFITALASLFVACTTISPRANAVDLKQVEQELTGAGAVGWVHGSVKDEGIFVFTYRNPKNFFDYVIMSLVPKDDFIATQLTSLGRHDKVRVKGSFLWNPSPQKHIEVTEIARVEEFKLPGGPFQREAKIPDDLKKQSCASFLVHAVAGEGHIVVLEYKDSIVPMFSEFPELTKNLFRNDVIRACYVLQTFPGRPTHLNIDAAEKEPIKVTEAITALHGKPADMTGALVLFPKSPEIIFNVFALQQELSDGLKRQYTLVNFDDPELFKKIREKLQAAWDKYPNDFVNGRNKLMHKKVFVRAKGVYNQIDKNQANPQILLKSVDDVQIIVK